MTYLGKRLQGLVFMVVVSASVATAPDWAVSAAPFQKWIWGAGSYPSAALLTILGVVDPGAGVDVHAVTTGAGVRVAVLDTGIQATHPDLAGSVDSEAGWDFVGGDADPTDAFTGLDSDGDGKADPVAGHGTFVAGLVRMVAPEVKLVAYRVLDSEGKGAAQAAADALALAVQEGVHVAVLPMVAPSESKALAEAVEAAAEAGVLVVAAAGNAGTSSPRYPAASRCALSVAALDGSVKAQFSSYGDAVDFAAPGSGLYSTFPTGRLTGESRHVIWSGSSFSAALVAGQAALVLALEPQLSPRGLAALLAHSAKAPDLDDTLAAGLGNGLPYVAAAVAAMVDDDLPDLSDGPLEEECGPGGFRN